MLKRMLAGLLLFSAVFAANAVDVANSHPFSVSANPIIRWQKGHFSSDPAVEVIHGYKAYPSDAGRDLLLLLTSTDLCDVGNPSSDWPMNGTRLYWTFGDNSLQTTWWEYDTCPVLQEKDFAWINPNNNHMFAPDILCVPGGNGFSMLYFFVPDFDKNNIMRIGVARAGSTAGTTLFDQVTTNDNYITISPGPNGSAPNGGFGFDPGAFYAEDTFNSINYGGFFMVYVHAGFSAPMNLSFLQMQPLLTSATYLGKVGFKNYATYADSCLNHYMEGPDVHVLTTPINHNKHYYLVFAAQVMPGSNDPGYIGYAMASPKEFWASQINNTPTPSSQATCWTFKGWLFKNIKSGRNNQVSLAQLNGHYYAIFHRLMPEFNNSTAIGVSRSRQVCAKEIELIDNPGAGNDGEIVGVSMPADQKQSDLINALDGQSKTVTKNFVYIKDESYSDNSKATVRLSKFTNRTGSTLSQFRVYYYVNVKPGMSLIVDKGSLGNFTMSAPYLKHIGQRTWAVALDHLSGQSLGSEGSFTNAGDQFGVRALSGSFDKQHDNSLPLGNYSAWSSRVAVKDLNGNLLEGETPDVPPPVFIKTAVADANNQITYLTASTANANDGINNQIPKFGDRNQWIMEDASDFRELSDADRPNAVRIRNLATGYYVTCDITRQYSGYYYLFNCPIRPSWNMQVWIKEDAGNGLIALRCMWKDYTNYVTPPANYLTRNVNSSNTGTQAVYVRPQSGAYLPYQKWSVSASPTSMYVRANYADMNGTYTYLTIMNTNENAGITNQYIAAGFLNQEWTVEDASDYSGSPAIPSQDKPYAFRLRNVATGYYMTCNNDITKQPHYWLLNQALHKDWNTQVWIRDGNRIRCAWRDFPNVPNNPPTLYLTLAINSPDAGTKSVYVQPLSGTTGTQTWFIE